MKVNLKMKNGQMKKNPPAIGKKILDEAIISAISAYENAYVPLTNYSVGSCIITDEDELFAGCNVQSVISGLGTCAESSAIFHSVVHGKYNFKGIVVASKKAITPCGACLQYLNEFAQVAGHDIRIIAVDLNKKIQKDTSLYSTIKNLYGPLDGKKDIKRYKKSENRKKK